MRKLYIIIAALLFTGTSLYAQAFFRVGEIPVPEIETEGISNFIAGMDMDGDGLPEIVSVNQNQLDAPNALTPRIYKYEYDGVDQWNLVWSAELDIPLQNSWPPLTYGDMDKDGKGEVYWGPVNYFSTTNTNPSRIVVFESRGPGDDAMGVQSGENSLPNAQWTIVADPNVNLRPFRWVLHDIDSDGTDELIYASRAGEKFGIVSVSDIPDNGGGTETWTMEFSSEGQTVGPGTFYDVAVIDNAAYFISTAGVVTPVYYSTGAYSVGTVSDTIVPGGSWKSASAVDIDKDGIMEIVVAGWTADSKKVHLIQDVLGELTATEIADFSTLMGVTGRIYGGASGDIDLDGNVDFVFGSRQSSPDAMIIRLEYAGGDITNSGSYVSTVIDHSYTFDGRWDELAIAQVDQDPDNEVLYTVGFDNVAPIVIIDHTGMLPVELKSFSASVNDNSVNLNWTTATEINNRGFEVERSANDGRFITVGFVNGKGTTNDPQKYSFSDNNLTVGKYSYRLKQVDFNGTFSYSDVVEVDMNVPVEFSLNQNYPNPFNPSTTIQFGLTEDADVKLAVYNMIGEEVALLVNEFRTAGTHQVTFNASGLPSGTYVYRLEANGEYLINKMVLLK
jgi:hypothetical protein